MDKLLEILSHFGPGTFAIALASWGILRATRRIPAIANHETYRACLPLVLIALGIVLGVICAPLFPGDDASIRGLAGCIGSSFSGHLVSFGRRLAKLVVSKRAGASVANELFAGISDDGTTLPPEEDLSPESKAEPVTMPLADFQPKFKQIVQLSRTTPVILLNDQGKPVLYVSNPRIPKGAAS